MTAVTDVDTLITNVTNHIYNYPYEDLEYIGLYKGKAGFAYSNFYLYKFFKEEKYAYKAIQLITEVFDELNNPNAQIYTNPSIVSGLAGIGLCLQVFQDEHFLGDELSEQLDILDSYLIAFFKACLKEQNTDFFGGAIGILNYIAQRYISYPATQKATLDYVIELLDDYLLEDEFGIRLTTRFGYLKKKGVDLSTAHGIVGLYLLLLKLHESGYQNELVSKIIIKGINYIIYVKQNAVNTTNSHTIFPNFIEDQSGLLPLSIKVHHSYRLAWCNGDLNILWLLERAGKVLKMQNFTREADKVKQSVITRTNFESTRIEFSYFCHGTSGVAQTYFRLFELTGDEIYSNAYQFWIEACRNQLEQDFSIKEKFPYRSTILFGWTGALLTLLNYKTRITSNWDQIFLLS